MPPSADRATVLGLWAQSLYLLNDAVIDERTRGIMDQALAIDPNESSTLNLLAFDALAHQDIAGAIGYWRRQLAATDPNSQQAQTLRQRIAAAQSFLPEDQQQAAVAAANASITLAVDLDPALKEQLASAEPGEFKSLFVYVRNPAMPAPIVAKQVEIPEFPFIITLDNSMSMTGMTLDSAPELLAGARLSRSGVAVRGSGDLQGETAPFALFAPGEQAEPLQITIDQIVQ
jgi:cytochrome c-type biogenesis protein CcmH